MFKSSVKRGLVDLGRGYKIYAEFKKPGRGQPFILFLNGLTYSTRHWLPTIRALRPMKFGYLTFDFRGQGRSLQSELADHGSFFAEPHIDDQVQDLLFLLEHFRVESIDHVIGLSYGGGVALRFATQSPIAFDRMTLAVPYLTRLDLSHPFHRVWQHQWSATKAFWPMANFTSPFLSQYYRQFIIRYMNMRFAKEVPDDEERHAAICMSLGIMAYSVFDDLRKLPSDLLVNLITAGKDTLIPRRLYEEFWEKLPSVNHGARLFIQDAGHIVPMSAPDTFHHWLKKLLNHDYTPGHHFRHSADHPHVDNLTTGEQIAL